MSTCLIDFILKETCLLVGDEFGTILDYAIEKFSMRNERVDKRIIIFFF